MRAVVLAIGAALALGGCATAVPAPDASTVAAARQTATTASLRAQAALAKVCEHAPVADAAFQLARYVVAIPDRVVVAEAQAYGLIARVCAAPPDDPVTAYRAAQDAYATLLTIRDRWRRA